MWYYTRPGVGILARKSGLALNLHALSSYQYYLCECYYEQFLCLWYVKKPNHFQGFFPLKLQKGSAMNPQVEAYGTPPPHPPFPIRPSAAFCATLMFHAPIIWAPLALPKSTFFLY